MTNEIHETKFTCTHSGIETPVLIRHWKDFSVITFGPETAEYKLFLSPDGVKQITDALLERS